MSVVCPTSLECPPLSSGEASAEISDEPSSPIELPGQEEPLECAQCEKSGLNLKCMVCNLCQVAYCETCWPTVPAHKEGKKSLKGVRKQLHEAIDPVVERKLDLILEPQIGEEDQEALHRMDEDTAWFAVVKDDAEKLIFQDLGRYANVVSGLSDKAYPALISFVGSTGSGKSTLIRMLMELDYLGIMSWETPVVQSAACFSTIPTSGDVHLFCDPHTCSTDSRHPILYADCEGLEGGERTPLGSRTLKREKFRKIVSELRDARSRLSRRNKASKQSSRRELRWATDDATKRREFIVSELYPRILFTFSDVVVFVLRETNKLENAIERLLIWATAALEKSSNQPVLPHAIIALNSLPNEAPDVFWSSDTATKRVLDEANIEFSENPKFKPFIKHWRERGKRVGTVRELLKLYYDRTSVVGIPKKGRSTLMQKQVSQLYLEIKAGVMRSHGLKLERRMLMNSMALQFHLQSAYDHFANSLSTPFDFVKSTFAHSPIPPDFSGSILKLILSVRKQVPRRIELGRLVAGQMEVLFGNVASMVASCILLDISRQQYLGSTSRLFSEYKHACDNAFKDFYEQHLECGYRSDRDVKIRCVNYRVGHKTKGHQDASGKIIAQGEYVTSLDPSYIDTFGDLISKNLASMEAELEPQRRKGLETKDELNLVAKIHKDKYMIPFYDKFGGSSKFISHTACLVCLVHSPEHHLKCGHVICTPCLQTYGVSETGCITIKNCPMHSYHNGQTYQSPQVFAVKPPPAGVRILSIDGGGVRGLSQLIFLQCLENTLGFNLQLTSFFDLVVGTSTGGYIALGLITENWSITECIEQFKKFCRKSFKKRKLGSFIGHGSVQEYIGEKFPSLSRKQNGKHKYKESPVQNSLMKAFSTSDYLFGSTKRALAMAEAPCKPVPKVAVVTVLSVSDSKAVVLGNYNHADNSQQTFYDFPRAEIPENEFRTWEAARATCAPPGYLKEFSHAGSNQVYVDGGVYNNNPINIADSERKLIWPEVEQLPPDIVLSLGSGYNPNPAKPQKEKKFRSQSNSTSRGNESRNWRATDPIESSIIAELTWDEWLGYPNYQVNPDARRESFSRTGNRYVRWNAKFNRHDDPPQLDDHDALQRIETETYKQVQALDQHIKIIADHLICSTFYFELQQAKELPAEDGYNNNISVGGHIMCRWGPHSDDIPKLGELLQGLNSRRGLNELWTPYFTIQEIPQRSGSPPADQIHIPKTTINNMIHMQNGGFEIPAIEFTVSSRDAIVEISLHLDNTSEYPISGFPCQVLMNMPTGISPQDPFFRRVRTSKHSIPSAPPTTANSARTSDSLDSSTRDSGSGLDDLYS
ncbi:hypothetical protein TWF506_003137 [Arthrobotrys conoides]|uniref:FabD/lysophospholipase-like protein n=1 Tax=Arthrobotrys conoides TaxID=74498 RepID=A0AAN8RRE2_9PEZI